MGKWKDKLKRKVVWDTPKGSRIVLRFSLKWSLIATGILTLLTLLLYQVC